jgi:hypothetical protein
MTVEERVQEALGAIDRRLRIAHIENIVRESIEAAFEAGAEQEREACAKIADRWADDAAIANVIAERIRARGNRD